MHISNMLSGTDTRSFIGVPMFDYCITHQLRLGNALLYYCTIGYVKMATIVTLFWYCPMAFCPLFVSGVCDAHVI